MTIHVIPQLSNFLHCNLCFRVIGAIIIVVGLYLVLWGKSKDRGSSESDSELLPIDQVKANANIDAKILVNDHVSSKVTATCESV